MKRLIVLVVFFVFSAIPVGTFALPGIDVEIAIGGWAQTPSGDLSYVSGVPGVNDTLDLETDLGFDDQTRITGRAKIELPIVPNIYLVASPMEFEGSKTVDMDFTFGDQSFTSGMTISSKLTLNQYDIGLYYGVPFLKTATLDRLNIDFGVNARIMEIKAEIMDSTLTVSAEKSITVPVPMLFLAVQFKPVESFALEAEARGLSVGDNKIFSMIGRAKATVFGPAFIAGGYRYDAIEIDEEDVLVDVSFSGPFLEAGLSF
ncbi:MAG: TIGR04219 family outer membrane beta-barrel protein [Pseudomonadota bacterium]